MKLGIFKTLFVALVGLAFASAGYSQTVNIRAQIPFRFAIGGQTYPAGEYAVKTLQSYSNLTYIGNRNKPKSTMTLPHSVSSGPPAKNTVLLFHRIGGTYFLYQLWAEGSRVGLQFRQSPEEKELAMNKTNAETVSIAANFEQ
jgi:hypothetical protein